MHGKSDITKLKALKEVLRNLVLTYVALAMTTLRTNS